MPSRAPRTDNVPPGWLQTADVARRFNVNATTVLLWHRRGLLNGVLDAKGKRRFDPALVESFDSTTPRKRDTSRNGLLTASEAAAVIGRSEFYVRNHARAGDIPFEWMGGARLFKPADLKAHAAAKALEAETLLSFNEAARRLGYTGAAHVTRMVQRGQVWATLDSNHVRRIPVDEVQRLIAERAEKIDRREKRKGV
ncbi:hypothetical protein [Paraburkholderia sp. C35]|uniref:hypothetical protein n=1 Tax=Paraburkholderia sp. C35 TaxID=2126993 RepID=UPI000D68BE2D|nr:hypothetical protein [Paraburkholderia sp. C35]